MPEFNIERYPRSRNKSSLETIQIVLDHVNHKVIAQIPLDVIDARAFIVALKSALEIACEPFYTSNLVTPLTTKLRDAGRRSAPWRPTSSVLPGRPQDGSDGNRINRWLLPPDHKFYADEITATLVECKYYLQLFSMFNAPTFPIPNMEHSFSWLIEHPLQPGAYKDPIQLIDIDFQSIMEDKRLIQSGHLYPLDRGGRHVPRNTFLMLARSNQIQGNQTVGELINLMRYIVEQHNIRLMQGDRTENLIEQT